MADIVIEAPGVSAASLLAELHGQCFVQAWPETEMAQLLGSPGASAFIAIKASLPTGFLIARQAADVIHRSFTLPTHLLHRPNADGEFDARGLQQFFPPRGLRC